MQDINIIGVGYIGSVIACYLAENGYQITAIDKEPGVENKREWFSRYSDIRENIDDNQLENIETSTSYSDISEDGVSIVCVDTPVSQQGIELSNLKNAFRSLSENIEEGHEVVLRSTILPQTSEKELIPVLEESGLEIGEEVFYCYAPEFVRGGSGLEDLENPSKNVISGDQKVIETFRKLFPKSENTFETDIRTAEAVKYFDNIFHGLKVSLANEAGRTGNKLGFDPETVMSILASDQKLNSSEKYMNPGKSFGGPCLRKDINAFKKHAERKNVDIPVISSIVESNDQHSSWIISQIEKRNMDNIGLVGLTYKSGFNSTADSPSIRIGEELEEKGYSLNVYDPEIEQSSFEHTGLQEVAESSELAIIFHEVDRIEKFKENFDGEIIDLSSFSI